MDLSDLEVVAGRLLEEQRRLKAIDSELAILKQEIKEMPRRAEKDKGFYALIGLNWTEPAHANREGELKKERANLLASIAESQGRVLQGFSSEGLVVPLEPNPTVLGDTFVFSFRSGATFPKTLEELSEVLGVTTPITIGQVVIRPERVEVREADQYFAKERIVEAFENIRKTVGLKFSKHQQ